MNCRLLKSNQRGQATTELAIFGTILLLAFAALLQWGQIMNKQQEVAMLCFRKAMHKAYHNYQGGNGFGGASYRMLERVRVVEPFNKYYTGRQRQQLGASNVILWDPDILYAKGNDSRTYYSVDGQEQDLGASPGIWDVVTATRTEIGSTMLERRMNQQYAKDTVSATAHDYYTTTFKRENEDGTAKPDIVVTTEQQYDESEEWSTPW